MNQNILFYWYVFFIPPPLLVRHQASRQVKMATLLLNSHP